MNTSLADRASAEIRAMILDLRLLPGQAILIDDLATRLGMSRTPVREAVARLSTGMEGLVTTVPRKGMMVTIPTVEGMREIYEIIDGLESEAVRLAIGRADAEMLATLTASVVAQEAALERDDLAAWVEADRQFHRLMIEAAGNRRMRELVQLFDGQLHRIRVATIHLRATPVESTREHHVLLDAIRAGDLDAALTVHRAHRERALHEMLHAVAEYSGVVLRAVVQGSERNGVLAARTERLSMEDGL